MTYTRRIRQIASWIWDSIVASCVFVWVVHQHMLTIRAVTPLMVTTSSSWWCGSIPQLVSTILHKMTLYIQLIRYLLPQSICHQSAVKPQNPRSLTECSVQNVITDYQTDLSSSASKQYSSNGRPYIPNLTYCVLPSTLNSG